MTTPVILTHDNSIVGGEGTWTLNISIGNTKSDDLIYKLNIIKKQAFHTSKTQVPIYREYNFKPTPHPQNNSLYNLQSANSPLQNGPIN